MIYLCLSSSAVFPISLQIHLWFNRHLHDLSLHPGGACFAKQVFCHLYNLPSAQEGAVGGPSRLTVLTPLQRGCAGKTLVVEESRQWLSSQEGLKFRAECGIFLVCLLVLLAPIKWLGALREDILINQEMVLFLVNEFLHYLFNMRNEEH